MNPKSPTPPNLADVRRLVRFATQRTGAPYFDEDLVQDAVLRALAAFRRATHIENPGAFLMKVVQDTVSDHWRRRRSAAECHDIESIDERLVSTRPDFESRIDDRRRCEALQRALAVLDPEKRITIDLFYREGLSVSEIASRQSKSSSAVKMELLRARQKLARIIKTIATKKSR